MTTDSPDGPNKGSTETPQPTKSRSSSAGAFAGAEDLASILGLALVVLVLIGAPLALIRSNDGAASTTDIEEALAGSSVTLPSESDTFAGSDTSGADSPSSSTSAECGEGRIDLLTADEEAINAVRGLRQTQAAALVVANREFIQQPVDLIRVGIRPAQVSRIFMSREACLGSIQLDDLLPSDDCGPDDLDINTAFPSELDELQGLEEEQAQLLLDNAPFADINELAAVEGIAERTVAWLSLNDTCLYSIRLGTAANAEPPPCSERVDLKNSSIEEIMGVRGLHQSEAAEVVASNSEAISSIVDLVELGVDHGRVGRLLASHEACFGEINPDDELPGSTCRVGDINLNSATVVNLLEIEGITPETADLLITSRPFASADEISDAPQLPDSTLTWLSLASTCIGAEEPAGVGCGIGRIDLKTASIDELTQLRGLRSRDVAQAVLDNQENLVGLVSLIESGLSESAAGKLIASLQSCIGDHRPEHDLPSGTCGPLSLDLNTADIVELVALEGLTPLQADLLIANRPYNGPSELLEVTGIDPGTYTRIALLETCVESEFPASDG